MAIENSGGFDQSVELRLQFALEGIEQGLQELGEANEEIGHLDKNLGQAEKRLDDVANTIRDRLGKEGVQAVQNLNEAASQGASEWDNYVKSLNDAREAYQEFRRGEITGEGGGRPLSSFSNDELDRLRRIRDADRADPLVDADRRAAERGSRNYNNASVRSDEAIRAREEASKSFSRQLREQMEAEQKAAQIAEQAAMAQERVTDSIISQRYALYDVATTYGVISASMLAMVGYSVSVGASFESAFTGVERTAREGSIGISDLRDELVALSTQIPKTFEEISEIAQLGAQLDIPRQDLGEFSRAVAEFAATSGVSIDATAQGFGRIAQLLKVPASEFQNLGSAILYAGNNAVATEQEVFDYAQRLAQVSALYKASAQDVTAYAAVLASTGNGVEASQGAMQTIFGRVTKSITEQGDELGNLAALAGMTASEFAQAWGTDAYGTFTRIIGGLSTLDAQSRQTAYSLAGIGENIRETRTLNNLANNYDKLREMLGSVGVAYDEATYQSESYAMVLDDLNSQWQIFVNNINALIDAISGGSIPGLAALVGEMSGFIKMVTDFVKTDTGQGISRVTLAVVALGGAMLALRSISALATASTYALITAQKGLAASGAVGGVRGLANALFLLNREQMAAATGAQVMGRSAAVAGAQMSAGAKGAVLLAAGLRLIGKATVVLAVMQLAISLLTDMRGTMVSVADLATGFWQVFKNVQNAIVDFANSVAGALPILGGLRDMIAGIVGWMQSTGDANYAGFREWAKTLPTMEVNDLDASAKALDYTLDGLGDGADGLAGSLGGLGDSASGAAREVRTLADYANDLRSVFDRAFEIRFGASQGQDAVQSSWNAIAQAIEDTNREIEQYHATMQKLTADKAVKEYWLSVAEMYGDTLRAQVLRGELADINNDLTKTQEDLTRAQQRNEKGLEGNSQAAIDNRAEILGLVGGYQEYIAALAASGMSQEELQIVAARLKQEFIAQAVQMGYSRAEVDKYAAAFDGMAVAISKIPRNITVEANADPALQALNEFFAQAQAKIGSGLNVPVNTSFNSAGLDKSARAATLKAEQTYLQGTLSDLAAIPGTGSAMTTILNRIREISSILNSGNYWTGGYTGPGGKYEPRGMVHANEFVFSSEATRNLGVQNLAYMHSMAKLGKPVMPAGGGLGNIQGPILVQLVPSDLAVIAQGGSATVEISGTALQSAVNEGNNNSARRRTN